MKSKAEIEIDFVRDILAATADDFRQIERWWPKSKRGVNARLALDSLARCIETALQCTADARAALSGGGHG